jgi:hypothetical protein
LTESGNFDINFSGGIKISLSDIYLAFLLASGIAYYCLIPLPHPVVCCRSLKKSKVKERICFFIAGTLIISLSLLSWSGIFHSWFVWGILGVVYTMASVYSYLGYVIWNVLWQGKASDIAQIFMSGWDLGIATIAFIMMLT